MITLVTGATGFIGRHLIKKLLEEGEKRIRVVTRFADRLPAEWGGLLQVVEGNLQDKDVAQKATEGVSLIYHLAAERHDPSQMQAVNVDAVYTLLGAAKEFRVEKFIYLSSVGVVGAHDSEIVTEATPCKPTTEYERTKLNGEEVVKRFSQIYGLNAIILRPTIVFGERSRELHDSFLEWLRAIKNGHFVFIGGNAVANYIYVGDLVAAMIRLADCHFDFPEVFIIAEPVPMDDFINAAAQALEVAVPKWRIPISLGYGLGACFEVANRILGIPAPLTVSRVRAISSRVKYSALKLKKQTKYQFPFGYRNGLVKTISWYREKGNL